MTASISGIDAAAAAAAAAAAGAGCYHDIGANRRLRLVDSIIQSSQSKHPSIWQRAASGRRRRTTDACINGDIKVGDAITSCR